MTESQDATLLQRRARRRLVGAIALVVLIVIVLPIVLDKEPSPIGQDLVIQIPSQEAGKFNTRVLPLSAPGAAPSGSGAEGKKSAPAKTAVPGTAPPPASPTPTPTPAPAEPPAEVKALSAPASNSRQDAAPPAKDQSRAAKDESNAARAKALLEGKETWVVRLGAFASEDNVRKLREKLTAAGVKSYTETVKGPKGEQTRVRAGPFDSKLEAEQAQEKLVAMGVSPGTVAAR